MEDEFSLREEEKDEFRASYGVRRMFEEDEAEDEMVDEGHGSRYRGDDEEGVADQLQEHDIARECEEEEEEEYEIAKEF